MFIKIFGSSFPEATIRFNPDGGAAAQDDDRCCFAVHARNEERAARERLRLAQADPRLAQRLRLALDAPPPAALSAASTRGWWLHEATRERQEGPSLSEHTAATTGPCAGLDARIDDGTSESSASELSESLTTISE